METEREKIMPFYNETESKEEKDQEQIESHLHEFSSTALTQEADPIPKWNYLDKFYKRLNKVISYLF